MGIVPAARPAPPAPALRLYARQARSRAVPMPGWRSGVGVEAGHVITNVAFGELRFGGDCAGEHAFAEGLNGTKPMPSSASVGSTSASGSRV